LPKKFRGCAIPEFFYLIFCIFKCFDEIIFVNKITVQVKKETAWQGFYNFHGICKYYKKSLKTITLSFPGRKGWYDGET